MGCTDSKAKRPANLRGSTQSQSQVSMSAREKRSGSIGMHLFREKDLAFLTEGAGTGSGMHQLTSLQSRKRMESVQSGSVRVEILEVSESCDQITAKITRLSPKKPHHKRSLDERWSVFSPPTTAESAHSASVVGGESISSQSSNLQGQTRNFQPRTLFGVVHENPEFEESGTNHDLANASKIESTTIVQ